MPLFTTPSVNHYWAVETDDYLKIKRFVPFTRDTDNVQRLDSGEEMAAFRKGDYAPIPVWIRGDAVIIPGGIAREDLELDIPSDDSDRPVVKRLAGILARARQKEIAAKSEVEDFWHAFRFLSQNFSAGSGWLRKLSSVLRQSQAFLRQGSLERDELREIVWQWVAVYVGRIGVDRFEEFVFTVASAPDDMLEKDFILSVALLERLLTAGQKRRILDVAIRLDMPSPQDARARLSRDWATDGRAKRLAATFDAKLVVEVQRSFEAMDRSLLGYFETIDDFVLLIELFGAVRLPNWIRYSIPKVIKSHFDIMITIETDLSGARLRSVSKEEIEKLEEELREYMRITEAFARMVGGEPGVNLMHEAYQKRQRLPLD